MRYPLWLNGIIPSFCESVLCRAPPPLLVYTPSRTCRIRATGRNGWISNALARTVLCITFVLGIIMTESVIQFTCERSECWDMKLYYKSFRDLKYLISNVWTIGTDRLTINSIWFSDQLKNWIELVKTRIRIDWTNKNGTVQLDFTNFLFFKINSSILFKIFNTKIN